MPMVKLSIIGGVDKDGKGEKVERVDVKGGEIIGIVGPTGSGKSTVDKRYRAVVAGGHTQQALDLDQRRRSRKSP